MQEHADAVVIGGGFYGLRIALHLREVVGLRSVVVLEAEPETMARASFSNQARVHNGYHYPRSILTGYRSQVNLVRFREEYAEAVVSGFTHYYAVSRTLSRTNARQFELFARRIGAAIQDAPPEAGRMFDPSRIEQVFLVEEPAFDARVLRRILLERIDRVGGVSIRVDQHVDRITRSGSGLAVEVDGSPLRTPRVISAVYSGINALHAASDLPLIDVQHELTEMALVDVPALLGDVAVTVMDGPFFSIMPFPSLGVHTLSHVRFTPHRRWRESEGMRPIDPYPEMKAIAKRSHFTAMYADVLRYLPAAKGMRHRESLYEAKTVLSRSADDDSRPILYRADHGLPGYTCVLGGKLDNIYDVLSELNTNGR